MEEKKEKIKEETREEFYRHLKKGICRELYAGGFLTKEQIFEILGESL